MGCEYDSSQLEHHYLGTDLKYLLDIEAGSFSMDNDYYELTIRCGDVSIEKSREDVVVEGSDHYLTIDTSVFPTGGILQLVVCAHVPDSSFPDAERTEIKVLNLCGLRRL